MQTLMRSIGKRECRAIGSFSTYTQAPDRPSKSMAPYNSAQASHGGRTQASMSPYVEVVTGDAQLRMGLAAFALRTARLTPTRIHHSCELTNSLNRFVREGTKAVPDVPMQELLSRATPL